MFDTLKRLSIPAAALLLSACAQLTMTPPAPTVENSQRLRQGDFVQVQVGSFKPDPKAPAAMDKEISMRGANGVSAPGGSFAAYLRDTLVAELRGANLLKDGADVVITGVLLDSQLDAGMSTGTGSIKARFVVTRGGQERYARDLSANATWESSFVAAVAVPQAAQQYEGLYRKLVAVLLDDADFRKALAKN